MKKTALFTACLAIAASAFALCPDAVAAEGKQRTERGRLVRQIVMKWGNHVQEAYRVDVRNWTGAMGPTFAKAKIDTLQRAADATNFDAMNDLLLTDGNLPSLVPANAAKAQFTARSLGDASSDLVFVPVTPCRILDTRVAGGQIAGGTTRGFDVTSVSDYSFQGGNASNCGGVGAAGSFAAAAINFTVVFPSSAGYITAFPFGGVQPQSTNMDFDGGGLRSTTSIVKLDQGASANEMTVYSHATTHLVADVIGYFTNPVATPLQCVEVDGTPLNLAAGAAGNAFAGACTAGYTAVETQCRPSIFGMRVAGSWTSHCNMVNDSASAGTVTATARCCRVPGR